MIGSSIGRYEIQEQLGAGGMGVVYKARDTRLNRDVAIKVIRPDTSKPAHVAAFAREARLCSLIDHPGIITVYDIVEDGGQSCIVMEFLAGHTLNDLIPPQGFPIEGVFDFALQIGEALEAAHAADVVHRDLKPGNVFVCSNGRTKILDFGLARLSRMYAMDETRTLSVFDGKMVGTIAYMAPEQARAEMVDQRADIFSFGIILSQMITGELPFKAPNPVALLRAMQFSPATPVRRRRPAVPASLESIVLRALEKNPENRFSTITEMLRLLRSVEAQIQTGDSSAIAIPGLGEILETVTMAATVGQSMYAPPATGTEKTSIAVLPFQSAQDSSDDRYLASGVASEVIRALTGVPSIRVAPQAASFKLAESSPNPMSVGRTLNTRYIVTGTLHHIGERLRVIVELADCLEERVAWSRKYDKLFTDIFEVQEDISRSIVSSLGGQLIRVNTDTAFRVATDSLDAWGLVRKAYHIWNYEFSPAGVQQALGMLRRALELDPQYAVANAYLGLYLVQTVLHGVSQNPDADNQEAIAATERAAELAPNDPEVLECCVIVGLQTSQFEKAVQRGRRAVKVAPFDLVAWGYLGLALASAGDSKDVIEAHEILTKLIQDAPDHPSLPYWLQFLTSAHIRMGNYEAAVEAGQRCVEMQPGYTLQQMLLAEALYQIGRADEARRVLASIPVYNPYFTFDHYLKVLRGICRAPEIVHQLTKGLQELQAQTN